MVSKRPGQMAAGKQAFAFYANRAPFTITRCSRLTRYPHCHGLTGTGNNIFLLIDFRPSELTIVRLFTWTGLRALRHTLITNPQHHADFPGGIS